MATIIDFETYYDKNYSLKNMPIAQYIRDPRFEVLGLAVKDAEGARFLAPKAVKEFFRSLPRGTTIVAHNAAFDLAIAWEHYSYFPDFSVDTKHLAAYLISNGDLPPHLDLSLRSLAGQVEMEKGDTEAVIMGKHAGEINAADIMDYAINDVLITERLYNTWVCGIPTWELRIAHIHTLMAAVPVLRFDCGILESMAAEDTTTSKALLDIVRSNEKFRELLIALGFDPPKSLSKNSLFMTKLKAHPDLAIRELADIRLNAKSNLNRTRAQRMLDIGAPLPVPLRYFGAHTGRSSGDQGLNMQNLPAGGKLREALLPPPGHKFIVVDSSQIEPRVLAELADDDNLREACYSGDLYTTFAAKHLYRKAESEITKEERKKSKPALLGGMYGQGSAGLQKYALTAFGVEIDEKEAKQYVKSLREGFPGIVRYWGRCEIECYETGFLKLPSGRRLSYPVVRREAKGLVYNRPRIFEKLKYPQKTYIYGAKLCENATQAVARDVVYYQAALISLMGYRIVLLLHDEVVIIAEEEKAEDALRNALKCFAFSPDWLPGIKTEGKGVIADNYGVKT